MIRKINARKIELCKKQKEIIRKISQQLHNEYKSDKLTYDEYFFKLSRFLRGRSEQSWISYYDDLIYKLCNNQRVAHILAPRKDKPINILSGMVLFAVLGLFLFSTLFISNPSITGYAIFDAFRQPVLDISSPIYYQNESLLFAINPTSSGVYSEAYIIKDNVIFDTILIECNSVICYDSIVTSRELSSYPPGTYEISIYDYNKNDFINKRFDVRAAETKQKAKKTTHDFICQKCSPHKVPPLSDIEAILETSGISGFTTLADYYPASWTIVDPKNGYIVRINSIYNKISWDIVSNQSTISKSYIIRSPERTLPATSYEFIAEINGLQDEPWKVIVADPTPQFARPDGVILNNTWTNQIGSAINIYQAIDEVNASDTDFIKSASNPTNHSTSITLSNVLDPSIDTGHILRYRISKNANAGKTINLYAELLQDSNNVIAGWSHENINNVFTTFSRNLTTTQVSLITNYSNLRLNFSAFATGGGAARYGIVSWSELEIPEATTSTTTSTTTTSTTTTTTVLPSLNVSIIKPIDNQQVALRKTFNITSKVTCLLGNCGNVYSTARFNYSTLSPIRPINSSNGEIPLSVALSAYSKNIINKTYNTLTFDAPIGTVIDYNNNLYVVGYLDDVDWRIMKFNSTLGSIWNRTYNPGTIDQATKVVADTSNNIYVIGVRDSVDWFVMKINSTGGSIWNRTYNPGGTDIARGVTIDTSNNIYVVGEQSGVDWRIMKLSSNGISIWNRTFDLGTTDIPHEISIDSNENVYVAGSQSSTDWRIMKLSSNGISIWNRTYNPGSTDDAFGVNVDNNNDVYVTGYQTSADIDWRIMKLSSNGISIWNRTFDLGTTDYITKSRVDSLNNVYVIGVKDDLDWVIMKLDSNGRSIWNITYNIGAQDIARSIAINKYNNDIYLAGQQGNALSDWRIMKLDNSLAYQSCGTLNAGQSCFFDWQINATKTGSYEVGVYYNSSLAGLINVTENRTVIVTTSTTSTTTTTTSTILPSLNVSINKPIDNENVDLRKAFNVTSKVTCLQANCDQVFATPRFNYSGLYPFRPINSSNGEIPLSIAISRYPKSIWNRTNPNGGNVPTKITTDTKNNIYAVGFVSGANWFVMKINTTDRSIWNRTYNPGATDTARGIAIDRSGNNIYVVGNRTDATANWFIMKINTSGYSIWNRTYDISGADTAWNIAIDSTDSNIYVIGDQGGNVNWRVMKINTTGKSIWNRTYNPGTFDTARGIAIDADNNIYVAGYESGGVQWRIMKINASGYSIWNRTYDPGAADALYNIVIDRTNKNLYAIGVRGDADNNWFIMKINTTGYSIWNRTYNPGAADVAYGSIVDSNNNLYVVGQRTDAEVNWFIMKIDAAGNSIWNRTYDPGTADAPLGVTIDSSNNIYAVGFQDSGNWRIMKLDNSLSYQSCGVLNSSQSCTFDWDVNGTKAGTYEIGVYYNTTSLINVTENRTVIVVSSSTTSTSTTTTSTILSALNVSISKPIDNENVNLRKLFNITSKVTCLQADCNEVFATARFNKTGILPNDPINSTENDLTPSSIAISRYPKSVWNRTYNIGTVDHVRAITTDKSNNIYAVGYSDSINWHIKKINATGKSIWNRTYVPGISDRARDMVIDKPGNNLYVVGFTAVSDLDWFIMKINTTGYSIWNRSYDLANKDEAITVAIDSTDSNIYVAGSKTETSYAWQIMKINTTGKSIWNRTYDLSSGDDFANGIAIDSNDNIYVAGNVTANSAWQIMKLDSNGNSIWNRTYNLAGQDEAQRITIDKNNNLYVTGFREDADLNWQIMKIDANGKSIWNRSYNPGITDAAVASITDSNNNLYVVGVITQAASNNDIFIMKFDAAGNNIWNRTYIATTSADQALAITIDRSNNIYAAGFENGADWRIMKLDNSLAYQTCGELNSGQSCLFDWQINATKAGSYEIGVYYNTTSLINVTENRTVIVAQSLPDLVLTNIIILPSGIVEPTINSNTSMNVTVTIANQSIANNCIVRIRNTTHLVFAPSALALSNPIRCIATWNMDYWMNAGIWNVTVNVTTLAGSNKMLFDDFTYNSLKASIITPTVINFTGNPGQAVNSSNAYPLTIKNAGNTKFNITLKGTDYIGKLNSTMKIIVTNSTINKTSTGIFTPITYTFQQLYNNVYPQNINNIFFRTFIPLNLPSQEYEGNITIQI